MIIIETSPNSGFFLVNGLPYQKNQFFISYDNIEAVESNINFTLTNVDAKHDRPIISRGYAEIQDEDSNPMTSWVELLTLLSIVGALSSNDVSRQDQTTDRISLFLAEIIDPVVSISGANLDAESFNVTVTSIAPIVGNFICMQENEKITQVEIIGVTPVSGNEYTIDIAIPLDYGYSNNAGCSIQNVDINKNASSTDISFSIKPASGAWDITRMMISMVLGTAGDDGKFGNIDALDPDESQYFRKEDTELSQNLFSVRDNSDFRLEGYDVSYPIRSGGGGDFGMGGRVTYAGEDKSGVVIRLSASSNESYKTVIRSDLTGIAKYRIKAQGHVVKF